MKDKLMFAVEVAVVFAVIFAVQRHVGKIPVVGPYLPGGQ